MISHWRYLYKPSKLVKCDNLGEYKWVYVEAPPHLAHQMGGLPVSRNEFGLIATNKMVLEAARLKAGLEPAATGTLSEPIPAVSDPHIESFLDDADAAIAILRKPKEQSDA